MTVEQIAHEKRALVLGGAGMLGRQVTLASRRAGYQTWRVGHEVPITNYAALKTLDREVVPHVVVNCAGLVPYKGRWTGPQMIATNALGPWVVREAFPESRVIHISTDCVFDGQRRWGERYSISDRPNATNLYGRSKALGECPLSINVRTSFIGFDHGLLQWVLSRPAGSTIPGWQMASWSGATVYDVADALVHFFDGDLQDMGVNRSGLVHLVAAPIDKGIVLQWIKELFELDITVEQVKTPVINRTLKPTHLIERNLDRLKVIADERAPALEEARVG